MAEKNNLKLSLDSKTIKSFLQKFRRKISRSYIFIEFGFDYINISEALFDKGTVNFKKIRNLEIPEEALDKGIPSNPEIMGN